MAKKETYSNTFVDTKIYLNKKPHDVNQYFFVCLKKAIVDFIFHLHNISIYNRKPVSSAGVEIKYYGTPLHLELPENKQRSENSIEEYLKFHKRKIVDFRKEVKYLIDKKSNLGFKKEENSHSNFNEEKYFDAIQFQLKEQLKVCSPIIYTGMKN